MNAQRLGQKVLLVGSVAGLFLGASAPIVSQENYPHRTIKIVVPAPPGPLLDIVPRIIANKLSPKWGQSVIVENRPGAAQNLGAEAVAKAEPDGYTLLVSPPGPLTVSQHVYRKLGFDPVAFTPVSTLIAFPLVVVVNPRLPVSNIAELIAYAKANPEKLTYGSPGFASTPQLATEEFMRLSGIRMVHVPYQGLGPALRDLLAGHIDVMFDAPGNSMPHVKEGELKVLAVTGETRMQALPDVPVISDALRGFVHNEWFAMVAPPKTSPLIVTKLSQTVAEILKMPDVVSRLAEFHVAPVGNSPVETAALFKRESARWQQVITAAGIKVE